MPNLLSSHLPFFFFLLLFPTILHSLTFPADITALKTFFSSLNQTPFPPSSCLSSWNFNLDPCLSTSGPHFTCGLRCSTFSNSTPFSRITELTLDSASYSGTLSPSIWSLTFLQTLDIADNQLHGNIPLPLTSLPPFLRTLSLSRNLFSGPLPLFPPAPSLEELYLDGNSFSGTFPVFFPSLRRLDIHSNYFSGQFPDDLRFLTNLNFLDASNNSFSGNFPSSALPPSLFQLSIRRNLLSGELPGIALAALPSLQVLDLSYNALSGGLPAAAFDHVALEQLVLDGNRFEWMERPAGGGEDSQLVALELSYNRLTGVLPDFIGSMPRLVAVGLEGNRFIGLIPVQYAMRAAGRAEGVLPFERLLLGGNYLYGPIPGMMQVMKEGTVVVSLADNCLFRCPEELFFCAGGEQKPTAVCRDLNPMIP